MTFLKHKFNCNVHGFEMSTQYIHIYHIIFLTLHTLFFIMTFFHIIINLLVECNTVFCFFSALVHSKPSYFYFIHEPHTHICTHSIKNSTQDWLSWEVLPYPLLLICRDGCSSSISPEHPVYSPLLILVTFSLDYLEACVYLA